jgi:hypothetical protein
MVTMGSSAPYWFETVFGFGHLYWVLQGWQDLHECTLIASIAFLLL